jgi:AcrR family transcriptional regulator
VPAGRPRSFDKNQALDRALAVFWSRGYEGTSMADLTQAMGINRPSLYAAFGDKQALFRAAVERYADGPGSFLGRSLAEPSAADAIRRLLFDAADELTMPGRPSGCLAVQGALSCGEDGVPAREVLAAKRAASEAAIRDRLSRAADEGDLPPETDADTLARYLATVFQGMAVQAASGATRDDLVGVARLALRACGFDGR